MNVVVLESEAYKTLQRDTFNLVQTLFSNQEREKPRFNWVDSERAAELLCVSKRTLQNWRDNGLLNSSQFEPGGKVYYHLDEIDRALRRHSFMPLKAAA